MKVALVGTGTIAETNHLPILISIPDVDVVAVCDSNEKRLSRVTEKFKIKNKFTNIDEMLNSTDAEIIDITTPGYTHHGIAMKSLLANKNVLLEKPATLKTIEAKELEDVSKKSNLKLAVCQTYRYSEPAIRFKNIQQQGGIGSIDRIIAIQHGSTIFGMAPWFWNEDISGGILFELGIHTVDLQCYLMGDWKKVVDVNIYYDKSLKFITSILATVKFEKGIGVVDLKWLSSSSFMHLYISGSIADAIMKFYPEGFILQQGDFAPLSEFVGELTRLWNFGYISFRKRYYKKWQLPHRTVIENFINSVKTNSEPLVPIRSVFPTIRLLEDIWTKARATRDLQIQ
jgi:predicted dehydrogenase